MCVSVTVLEIDSTCVTPQFKHVTHMKRRSLFTCTVCQSRRRRNKNHSQSKEVNKFVDSFSPPFSPLPAGRMYKPTSWKPETSDVSSSWKPKTSDDFDNKESVEGVAGDSSVGISEKLGTHHSTTGDGSLPPHRAAGKSDLSFYENDSVMLWSDDPEKEYFAYHLQREQEARARRGKSADDSLIGNSTLEDIQQEFSKWHQNGGQDPESEFPVLSASQKSPQPPTLDGFSLATTEKSSRKKRQIQADVHDIPPPKSSKIFPNVIYVTDTPATSVSLSKPSKDGGGSTASRGRNCLVMSLFLMGGACLAAAALGIYISVSPKQANNSNLASSIQNNNENAPSTGEGSSFSPAYVPSPGPSYLRPSASYVPTTHGPIENRAPTMHPTSPTTIQPTATPTEMPSTHPTTKESTAAPSFRPSTAPPAVYCGCKNCASAMNRMADGHSCKDRMNFLMYERGYTELGACRLVAGVEFPAVCGPLCDPDKC